MLLHNAWLSSRTFGAVLPRLAAESRVWAIDTLGQGRSDPAPAGAIEIATFPEAIADFCRPRTRPAGGRRPLPRAPGVP